MAFEIASFSQYSGDFDVTNCYTPRVGDEMKKIFQYGCYRLFIADSLAERGLTAIAVTRRLRLKSKSYLGMILRGQRRLQHDQILAFKEFLSLTSSEFDYLFHLVMSNDSQDKKTAAYHKAKLEDLRRPASSRRQTQESPEEILTHWYYPVILLHSTLSTKLSRRRLERILGIDGAEMDDAYAELSKLGLLEKSGENWIATPSRIKLSKRSWNLIQRQFLKDQLRHSLKTFDQSYGLNGKFYSQTLTFSRGTFETMWQNIKDQCDEYADRADEEASDELVQMNVQFFRLA